MPPNTFPVAPAAAQNLLVSQVNAAWGMVGAGFPKFWEKLGRYMYRDSVAKQAAPVPLQYRNGYYYFIAVDGLTYEQKARFEPWNVSENYGALMAGPIQAERFDSPNIPIELRPGEDPTGQIHAAISTSLKQWADYLPLIFFTRMLVNGRVSDKFPTATCYDGLGLFSLVHKINPTAKKGPASGTKPNLVQLAGAIDESGWAKVKDTLYRFPDVDGRTLPNLIGDTRPLILVPNEMAFVRWAHFLGGPSIPRELIQQGLNAGISSIYVGNAELMHWPYLATEAESGLSFDPEKRSYVFSGNGRLPLIFREEQTPIIKNTGPQQMPAHEMNADIWYARAYAQMGLGEYRGVVAVDEK